MRIGIATFLYDTPTGGGAMAVANQLTHALAARGHEVVVVTTHAGREAVREQDGDVTVHRIAPRNLYWVGEKDRQATWKKVPWQLVDTWNVDTLRQVGRLLERERVDVLHSHKLRGLSPAVWTAASRAQLPLVHTCHDFELLSPEGTLVGRVGRWAAEGAWFMRPYTAFRAGLSRAVGVATAPSAQVLDLHGVHGFFRSSTRMVVPNTHGFTARELEELTAGDSDRAAGDATLRVLYLGRLEPEKGVPELCAAFVRAAATLPQMRLDVAGYGSLEHQLRAQYGAHPGIRFHGAVSGAAKRDVLRAADLMVVPSVYSEPFGIVAVEAFAYGVPVVASRIGGLPDVVEDGVTGLLVPPGDVDVLEETLRTLAASRPRLDQMRAGCRVAARRYTVEHVVDEYERAYDAARGRAS